MRTIIATFENRVVAKEAEQALIDAGFAAVNVETDVESQSEQADLDNDREDAPVDFVDNAPVLGAAVLNNPANSGMPTSATVPVQVAVPLSEREVNDRRFIRLTVKADAGGDKAIDIINDHGGSIESDGEDVHSTIDEVANPAQVRGRLK